MIFCLISAGLLRADNGWQDHILSLTWENDATAGTDRHYTEGAWISYLSRDDALPGWLDRLSNHLPAPGIEIEAKKFGLLAGQELYTPENLRASGVVTNDRPYAGWLYAGFTLQRRGKVSASWLAMENLRLDLGIIGPEALPELTQDITHHSKPRGWSHQLRTELAFALRYNRQYFYRITDRDNPWCADVLPFFNASGGTVSTFLGGGGTLRAGYHIPNEFEAGGEGGPSRYGAYLFTRAEGRYVIRNIFLDGNTFTHSAHIGKEPWVGELRAGLTFVLKSVEVTAAQTLRTREFKGQKSNDSYGTATVTLKF